MSYYDGAKLLGLLDLNNKRPEIYMLLVTEQVAKLLILVNWWSINFYQKVKSLVYYIDMIMNLVV